MKVELLDGVFLLAAGRFGYTNPTNCNVYAVRGTQRTVLIDAGAGFEVDLLVESMELHGIRLAEISAILHTHRHWDHARGTAELARRSGCQVWIHAAGVSELEQGPWREFHVAPAEAITFSPVKVTDTIADGTEFDLGGRTLRAIHTPGHTADSTCFVLDHEGRRYLFSGDTIFGFGRPGVMTADTDFPSYRDSVVRIAELEPDALFPGHGIWIMEHAEDHVRYLAERLSGKWTDFGNYPPVFDSGVWYVRHHPERLVP